MMRAMLAATVLLCTASQAAAQSPHYVVFFAEWSGALDDAAKQVIQQAADAVKSDKSKLIVTGYADNKGSQLANGDLSKLRAQMVADTLVADGVASDRVSIAPGGELNASGVIDRRAEIAVAAAP